MNPNELLLAAMLGLMGGGWIWSLGLLKKPWRATRLSWTLPLRLPIFDVLVLIASWIVLQFVGQMLMLSVRGGDPIALSVRDISNWPQFIDLLRNGDQSATPSPAKRITQLLSEQTNERLRQAGIDDLVIRQVLIDELNQLLTNRDLYTKADFEQVPFNYSHMFDFEQMKLGDRQITVLNRLLLEAAFPGLIKSGLRPVFLVNAAVNTVACIILLTMACQWMGLDPRRLGLHRAGMGQRIAYGLAQALFWGPISLVVAGTMRMLLPPTSIHPAQNFFATQNSVIDWLLLVYTVTVLAPFLEELIFRGIVQGWLSRSAPPWVAIGGSALLFGFAHSTWPDPIPLTLLGIGLGWTYQKTRSLWGCIAFHSAFNAFGILAGIAGQ